MRINCLWHDGRLWGRCGILLRLCQACKCPVQRRHDAPGSVLQELETVENEVESQIQAVSSGSGDPSNLKSWLSGVEQQMNALKAIAGFD